MPKVSVSGPYRGAFLLIIGIFYTTAKGWLTGNPGSTTMELPTLHRYLFLLLLCVYALFALITVEETDRAAPNLSPRTGKVIVVLEVIAVFIIGACVYYLGFYTFDWIEKVLNAVSLMELMGPRIDVAYDCVALLAFASLGINHLRRTRHPEKDAISILFAAVGIAGGLINAMTAFSDFINFVLLALLWALLIGYVIHKKYDVQIIGNALKKVGGTTVEHLIFGESQPDHK